jgi:hypothetical protein
MALYNSSSPYATTPMDATGLGIMKDRTIPKLPTDQMFTINLVYAMRPDLLAHDLYDNSQLWWVFANRNPNVLKDPLFDFTEGTTIYLPRMDTLKTALGL